MSEGEGRVEGHSLSGDIAAAANPDGLCKLGAKIWGGVDFVIGQSYCGAITRDAARNCLSD